MARDMPGPPVSSSPDGRPDVADRGADSAGAGQPPGRRAPRVAAEVLSRAEARETPEAALCHAPWLLGSADCRVPFLHPVAAPPRRHRPGPDLGHHRGHRLRARRARRVDLACLRRPGPPAPAAPVLAVFFITAAVLVAVSFGLGQYWQYEIRKLMGVTEYNVALVVASPFVAALIFCLLLLIGRGLRGLYRWAATLLNRWIGRRAAHAVGWISGGRPGLPGGLRPAAAGLRQRDEQRVLGARHEDRRGDTPAHHQPAFGRTGLAHPVGHAGLARPQLHRQGPFGE